MRNSSDLPYLGMEQGRRFGWNPQTFRVNGSDLGSLWQAASRHARVIVTKTITIAAKRKLLSNKELEISSARMVMKAIHRTKQARFAPRD